MRTINRTALASLWLGLAACSPASGGDADGSSNTTAVQAASLVLNDQPPLSDQAEALPRLAGDGPAIARINADLDRMDAAARESLTTCAADTVGTPSSGYARSITRPMTGPAYLTVRAHLDYDCGGPYPATSQTAVTYDLATGKRLNWAAVLPGLGLTVDVFEDAPQGYVPLVSSAALGALYSVRALDDSDADWVDECRDMFDAELLAQQTFNIWADAETGGVTVQPDFNHATQACAIPATLTPADLRDLKAAPAFVAAITTAHAAGAWAPKDTD